MEFGYQTIEKKKMLGLKQGQKKGKRNRIGQDRRAKENDGRGHHTPQKGVLVADKGFPLLV